MAQWGNTDDAANSASYAPAQFKMPANTVNQTALYGNTTPDAFIDDIAVGQFGISVDEVQASRAGAGPKMAHAGWNLRTEGTGGRAGRVSYETLVAMRTITGDGDSNTIPDFAVSIVTQPSNGSGSAGGDDTVTFTVAAVSIPTGGTLSYQWQELNGSTWTDLTEGDPYIDVDTATLSVYANNASDGEVFRVVVTEADGATATSSEVTLTVEA